MVSAVRNQPEPVSGINRNARPDSPGTDVRIPPESLSAFGRTTQFTPRPGTDTAEKLGLLTVVGTQTIPTGVIG